MYYNIKLIDGKLHVSGDLVIDIINLFLDDMHDYLENNNIDCIDMSNVNKVDTSCVAALTCLLSKYKFNVVDAPNNLVEIAELSYIKKILLPTD